MSEEVTHYISNLGQAWQAVVCQSLHHRCGAVAIFRALCESVPHSVRRSLLSSK